MENISDIARRMKPEFDKVVVVVCHRYLKALEVEVCL